MRIASAYLENVAEGYSVRIADCDLDAEWAPMDVTGVVAGV